MTFTGNTHTHKEYRKPPSSKANNLAYYYCWAPVNTVYFVEQPAEQRSTPTLRCLKKSYKGQFKGKEGPGLTWSGSQFPNLTWS